MLIKLPRDLVEIIETTKEEDEEDMDVDIEGDTDMNSILYELRLYSDHQVNLEESYVEPHPGNQNIGERKLNIKHSELTQEEDFEERKPNIDDIVMENLNHHSASEYEAEDDEDADSSWEPWEKRSESEDSYASDSYNTFEDDWRPVPRGNWKTQNKSNKQKTYVTKLEHQCNLCEASFNYKAALVKHMNADHFHKFQCSLCKRSLSSSLNLRKHMFNNHGQFLLACPICREEFTSLEDINNHISHDYAQSAHVCPTCMKVYTSDLYLKSHLNVCKYKKGTTTFKCEACLKFYSSKRTLEMHLQGHMGVIYKCEQCGKSFSHQRDVYRHRNIEHLGIVFRCEPCDKNFTDDRGLLRHKNLVHGSKKRVQYSCDTCGKTYSRKTDLHDHIQSVHYGLSYSCDSCGRTFTTKGGVERHQKTSKETRHQKTSKETRHQKTSKETRHQKTSKETRHQKIIKKTSAKLTCDICAKSYLGRRELIDHLQGVHYGLKYTCPLCDETFIFKRVFQTHERKHRLYQFNCHYCEKTFVSQKLLDAHLKLHWTNLGLVLYGSKGSCERYTPYECAYCKLSFTWKSHLQCHIHGYHFLSVHIG
ncbi:hypothetical protein WDU94_008125 [Cyamophila willieti]